MIPRGTHPPYHLITGATSGLGRAAALELGRRGLRLILVGRDPGRLARTVADVQATGCPEVDGRLADLSRMREAHALGRALAADYPRLAVLVNNAGALYMRREETDEGIERTAALNLFAPFLLTRELLPALRAGAPSRVVMVASAAHRSGRLRLADLEGRERYGGWSAYAQSKLALILLTRELAHREADRGVSVNACHPGFVRTRYGQNNPGFTGPAIRFLAALGGIPAARGAEVVVRLAVGAEGAGRTGLYFDRRGPRTPSAEAQDAAAGAALYAAIERRLEDVGVPAPGSDGPGRRAPYP